MAVWNDKQLSEAIENLTKHHKSLQAQIHNLEKLVQHKTTDDEILARELTAKIQSYSSSAEQKFNSLENILEEIEHVNNTYKSNKNALTDIVNFTKNIQKTGVDLQEKIKELEAENLKIQTTQSQANANLTTIQQVQTNINTYANSSEANSKLISDLLQEAQSNNAEVERLYNQIYGEDILNRQTNAKEHKDGLKDKLEKSYDILKSEIENSTTHLSEFTQTIQKTFDTFLEDSNLKRDELIQKIRSHLPDAITAGLAGAYSDKRKHEEKSKFYSSITFGVIVCFMLVIAGFSMYSYWSLFTTKKDFSEVIAQAPNILLLITPFYIPLLWIGLYTNKQMNLSKKLIEEYAFKEAICKTITGMKEQINALDEDDEDYQKMHKDLLSLIITMSEENPAKHISSHTKSDNPLMELGNNITNLDKLFEKAPNIKTTLQEMLNSQDIKGKS